MSQGLLCAREALQVGGGLFLPRQARRALPLSPRARFGEESSEILQAWRATRVLHPCCVVQEMGFPSSTLVFISSYEWSKQNYI